MLFNRYEPLDGGLPVSLLNTRYQTHATCFESLAEGHFEGDAYVADRVRISRRQPVSSGTGWRF